MPSTTLIRRSYAHASDQIGELRDAYLKTRVPTSAVVTITPAIARSLLERNDENRTINQRQVEILSNDIKARRWVVNGEAIILSSEGEVNDGQHRLWAVVESGLEIQTMLVYGVPRVSRLTVDLGRARTTGDFLGMSGVANATLAAAVAAKLLRFDNGRLGTKATDASDSKPAIDDYFFAHREEIEAAIAVTRSNQKLYRLVCNESVIVFTMIVMARHAGMEAAASFWEPIAVGADLAEGSPQLVIRNRFLRDTSMPVMHRVELIFRGWNAWREGRASVRAFPIMNNLPDLK